jgi:REP element-mobilizing transposase RayT
MARPLRIEHPGALWHVTNRGNAGENIFRSDEDRLAFLDLLGEAVRRYGWVVTTYTLLDNHFHLVFETPDPTLSRGMQWLQGKYAQWFNKRHRRTGHLFQGRFKAFLVEKETYLLEVLRYVVLNPVRAGMVQRPEDYRWSSYRAIAGMGQAPPWLAVDHVLHQFAPDHAIAQEYYRAFVTEKIGDPRSPWEGLIGRIYLGSESWLETIKERIESKPRSDDHPREQRLICRPEMAKIIPAVAEVLAVTENEIRNGHGGMARGLAAWLGCYEGILTRRAIAASLRLRSQGRVSDLIRTCDGALDQQPELRAAVDRCCDLLRRSPSGARNIASSSVPQRIPAIFAH